MLLLILTFIRQHWRGVVESLLLATIFIQHAEVSHLAGKLAQSKAENAMLQSANQQLSASIKSQNAAVASLQVESKRKSAAAAKSLALAQGNARRYEVHAAAMKAWKPTGDACADMKKLLNDYVKHGE